MSTNKFPHQEAWCGNKERFASLTLGCRANQYQTETLKSNLKLPNSKVVDFKEVADVYLINTCTVTEDADRTSRQAIRRAMRQNPKAKIIVAGCYAKLNRQALAEEFPQAEIMTDLTTAANAPRTSPSRIRENLMIQDGCDHFCSYCLVPYARGPVTSKSVEQVISEAKALVAGGTREIVLTGINLGTYQYDLSRVAGRLSKIPNLKRIRFSSIEPMYLTRELIDSLAKIPKICPHLHLPLQSGDDRILKLMRREYTAGDFLKLVDSIRKKIPDCGLTTDIIVGFPEEGEQEFQNTVRTIKKINFSRLHVFPYSRRPGTPAAEFSNQVEPQAKNARVKELRTLNRQLMVAFARQYQDKRVELLVEQPGAGLTGNFIRGFFNETGDSSGSLKLITAKTITNSGEIRG